MTRSARHRARSAPRAPGPPRPQQEWRVSGTMISCECMIPDVQCPNHTHMYTHIGKRVQGIRARNSGVKGTRVGTMNLLEYRDQSDDVEKAPKDKVS